jgi:ribonuclease VapC
MVIDSSALVAILEQEPEGPELLNRLAQAGVRRISAATLLEAAIVLESKSGDAAGEQLDLFLARASVIVQSVTADHVRIARHTWRRYGKGRGHAAALNFGDCFSYALAQASGEELLYKGTDFAATDLADEKTS